MAIDPHRHFRQMNERSIALVASVDASDFEQGDVRDAFLNVTCTSIANYCITLGLEMAIKELKSPISPEVDLVQRLFVRPTQNANIFRAKQRAHLFLDVWCAFEDALRILDAAVVPAAKRAEDDAVGRTGVPSIWQRVCKVAKTGGASTKAERQRHTDAVVFLSRTRNTIHSNTFYQGPPVKLVLGKSGGLVIELKPGEPTDFLSRILLPLVIDRLVEAWEFLRLRIRAPELIPTLASLRPNPYQFG